MRDLVGERLGDFEIVRELGRGGMGVVYEARQVSLNRKVALKVLSGGLGLTPKSVQRFQREAKAAAQLHHTNIVPVYATGEQGGTHFYAMELIDGPSMDLVLRHLRAGPAVAAPTAAAAPDPGEHSSDLAQTGPYVAGASYPAAAAGLSSSSLGSGSGYFDTVARLVAEVADALDYAHQQGVIHRDIKPANLLLSPAGRLSVNDFGLARVLEQPGMTLTGEFIGTPAYTSPEQIAGGRIPLDQRTDIYSLGATLYELLTLRSPFAGTQRDQVLAQIMHKEPVPPRKVNKKVPVDLETICLKCLEKDPDRRYRSAGELAEDLRRYVNRFAIAARRAGPLTKLKKWGKRNPALAAACAMILVAVAAAGYFAWQERRRAAEVTAEKRRAAIERGMTAGLAADLPEAEKAVQEAELLGASAGEVRLLRGFVALYSGRTDEAVGHLEQAARLMPDRVAARALLAYAHAEATDWPAARRLLDELGGQTPRTPEDRLFLGQALGVFRPADGLKLMNQALAERPSGIGHVLRAKVRCILAQDTGKVADAEDAVADAELAKRLLPGNPFPLVFTAWSHAAAAVSYRQAGRPDKGDEHLATAEQEAAALAHFPRNFEGVIARFGVRLVRDGLNGRMDLTTELRQARAAAPGPGLAYLEAYNLFCLGRDAEAGALADRFPDHRMNALISVLVALGRPDGRADARRAWERYGGPHRAPADRLDAAPLLFVVGGPGEVAALARDVRGSEDQFRYSSYSPADLAATLAFLEGKTTEAELLGVPVAGEVERCRRHSLIGWKRLGSGDRGGAAAAFQNAYAVPLCGSVSHWTIRAVLIRMRNPNWPQAIANP